MTTTIIIVLIMEEILCDLLFMRDVFCKYTPAAPKKELSKQLFCSIVIHYDLAFLIML